MSLFITFVFFGLICTVGVNADCNPFQEGDYALKFPNKGTTDYTTPTTSVPDLTEFTLCFWMNSTDEQPGSPFSYCTPSATYGNELLIYDYGSFLISINNIDRDTDVAANDGGWHQICVTWKNSDGSYQLYKDGELEFNGTDFQTGYTIKGGGTPIVGQEQDLDPDNQCGDNFDSSQSVQGSIANLNLWSCVVPAEAISEMYQSCLRGEGDVLKWSDFKQNVEGDTEVVVPNPCIH